MGGGGNIFIHSQVGKKSLDFGSAHLGGVAFDFDVAQSEVMKEDKALDPIYVRLLGAERIMLQADGFAHLIEKFIGCRRRLSLSEMVDF